MHAINRATYRRDWTACLVYERNYETYYGRSEQNDGKLTEIIVPCSHHNISQRCRWVYFFGLCVVFDYVYGFTLSLCGRTIR